MNLPVCLLESSLVGDLVNFQESDAPPVNAEVPRELREAEVLRPGTYTDMTEQIPFMVYDDAGAGYEAEFILYNTTASYTAAPGG
jgi:hypothetical protein